MASRTSVGTPTRLGPEPTTGWFPRNLGSWAGLGITTAGALVSATAPAQEMTSDSARFFESRIRPVLVEKCYPCHSPRNKVKGDLRLDTREGMLRGGEHGPALVPGAPDQSLLIVAMRYTDPDLAMPPRNKGGKLSDPIIADFERWVRLGAPDLLASAPMPRRVPIPEAAKAWWSYQPVAKPPLPQPRHPSWASTNIDRFVLAKLDENHLAPAPDADPFTLVRRLYAVLTGLPPPPDVAEAFAASHDPGRLEHLVDTLLDSRQFGEYWGRHWLDVARFAETTGRDVNGIYPEAWRYRNYVIDSFQHDKPFDRFVREQIAGDLLPDASDAERAQNLIATGFLALGPKLLLEVEPRLLAVEIADEQIEATSKAFLGVTIACARCHDHKTDPVTQRDYTALAGIFLSTDTRFGMPGGLQSRNGTPLIEAPVSAGLPLIDRRMDPSVWEKKQREQVELHRALFETVERTGKEPQPGTALSNGAQFDDVMMRLAELDLDLRAFNPDGTPVPRIMGTLDKPARPALASDPAPSHPQGPPGSGFDVIGDSPLFVRGRLDQESEKVPRGLPEFLAGASQPRIDGSSSGRLQLATWIASPGNPLTSRVFANRAWHWLMGRPLVTTSDDFGRTGTLPSHPELLDHLASRFVEQNWSVKKLIREIVLSHVFRLACFDSPQARRAGTAEARTVDPENILLWRANRRSLDAESLRDCMLMIGGSLDLRTQAGSLLARTGQGSISGPRFPVLGADVILKENGDYRSVYLPVARDLLPDSLALFNFADPGSVTGTRESTIVPSQALYLLNSEFVSHQASCFAARVLRSPGGFDDRFKLACLLAYGRPPFRGEREGAREFCARNAARPHVEVWTSICRALFASAEFRFL